VAREDRNEREDSYQKVLRDPKKSSACWKIKEHPPIEGTSFRAGGAPTFFGEEKKIGRRKFQKRKGHRRRKSAIPKEEKKIIEERERLHSYSNFGDDRDAHLKRT